MKKNKIVTMFLSIIALNSPLAGYAQNKLSIVGQDISVCPSSMDINFTQAGQQQLLCEDELDLSIYSSFIITFAEPVEVDGLSVCTGAEEFAIPKGIRSFQGFFTKSVKDNDWIATNGKMFSYCFAFLFLKSEINTKVRIIDTVVRRKDGTEEHCFVASCHAVGGEDYYSTEISITATNGETYTDFYEITWDAPEISNVTSGKIYISDNGFIGGSEWASDAANESTIYRIEFYSPVPSEHLAWKYITKSGDLRYHPIESGSLSSELSVDDAVKECSIVNIGNLMSIDEKTLCIKSATIHSNYPSGIQRVRSIYNQRSGLYDLAGRQQKALRKGITIVDGRKMLISK